MIVLDEVIGECLCHDPLPEVVACKNFIGGVEQVANRELIGLASKWD